MSSRSHLIAKNSNAKRNYNIEATFESGAVLKGWEVKSLRQNRLNLKDAHARILHNEVWLIGAHISPLPTSNTSSHPIDPTRTRKLLLHKKEIIRLIGAIQRKGYTLIPIQAYWKNQHVKFEIGLGKGKQTHDKRVDQKTRDWDRKKSILLKNKA